MDEEDESSIDRDLVRTSAIKLNSIGAGMLKRRARDRDGYVMAPSSDSTSSGGGGSPSKNKHLGDANRQSEQQADQNNATHSSAKGGFGFVSQAALASEGESQKGLRQRKSVSKGGGAAAHQQHPFSMTGLEDVEDDRAVRREGDSIPAIQVSRPPGPS